MEKFQIELQNIEELEGVLYKDIKEFLNSKEVFESVLFTTQLFFQSNEELLDFINKLIEFGYEERAFDYLENIPNKLTFDFSKLKYENKYK
jgi:hypothetical protein